MGFQHFCDKGPHRVLWTGSWAAREKITVGCVPYCVNYRGISVVYTGYNVAGPRVADPWSKLIVPTSALLKVIRPLFTQIVILPL